MQITIKVLKGKDCTLEVLPTNTILEVKQLIETALEISAANQKLLLQGRPLNNDQTISSYANIKDGTKLNLVVMKPCLRDCILRGFRKFYAEQQAERLTNEFMIDFETKLKEHSLDDLERFAESTMGKVST
ncbi:ubiquitin-like protein 4A [Drosophila guanche]|uniref:Blast:Ubiquitin-like protein 4A n=1 Tax=Drosophila guanche TaxID=7266 RepID=A0A3B0JMF5_DROGU|nr:ubiquitin-like protein 4A [Drosophila guanche]SPP83444.1 blast:Ubiquitin-like protein 4A [Drosophila guanche]